MCCKHFSEGPIQLPPSNNIQPSRVQKDLGRYDISSSIFGLVQYLINSQGKHEHTRPIKTK